MTAGKNLDNLYEAIISDALAASDEQIAEQASKEDVKSVRDALARAEQEAGKRALSAARSGLDDWKSNGVVAGRAPDREGRRAQFDRFRAGDKEFQKKATLAARNGDKPTERDLDGLADDYAELRRLEEGD